MNFLTSVYVHASQEERNESDQALLELAEMLHTLMSAQHNMAK